MIFLTYLLSLVIFYVAYLIVYIFSTLFIGFLLKIVSLSFFFQEWIKEVLTIPIAIYFSLFAFKWMDKSYNLIILVSLFAVFLFVTTLAEQSEKKYPQRLGYIGGILFSLFYLF